ncbi:MAG: glycosyltransferase [Chlorobia bacterium]|nr:glycosyltransferase [Fimbriimonadaceae bacterium]
MPKVSIIVPSYNHGVFLPQCIESVLSQTLEDWEFVIVDDGSHDDSPAVIERYKDPRIIVQRNERNLGTYGTQNRCLEVATGDFVAVLNSDDYWKPKKLEMQLAILDIHPDCSFSYTFGALADDSGVEKSGTDHHGDLPRDPIQSLAPWLVLENRVLASSVIFRRGAIRFDPKLRYSGDWVALLQLIQKGPAAYIEEPLTIWRQHGANSYKERVKHFGEEIRIRHAILANRDRWKLPGTDLAKLTEKLALCAISLSSVYVNCGDRNRARDALRVALAIDPHNAQAKKRIKMLWLPLGAQRARISPGIDPKPFEEAYRAMPPVEEVNLDND